VAGGGGGGEAGGGGTANALPVPPKVPPATAPTTAPGAQPIGIVTRHPMTAPDEPASTPPAAGLGGGPKVQAARTLVSMIHQMIFVIFAPGLDCPVYHSSNPHSKHLVNPHGWDTSSCGAVNVSVKKPLPVTPSKRGPPDSRCGLAPWIPALRGNDDVKF
jgi:hypothetical protein